MLPVATATSVRARDGKRLVTEGSVAETPEQLGGYFLLRAANLDEAIDIAGRIPGAHKGTVEIRPVAELPGLPEVNGNARRPRRQAAGALRGSQDCARLRLGLAFFAAGVDGSA